MLCFHLNQYNIQKEPSKNDILYLEAITYNVDSKGNSNVIFMTCQHLNKCDTYSLFRSKCTVSFAIHFRNIYQWSLSNSARVNIF